jgi:hypothetical protein
MQAMSLCLSSPISLSARPWSAPSKQYLPPSPISPSPRSRSRYGPTCARLTTLSVTKAFRAQRWLQRTLHSIFRAAEKIGTTRTTRMRLLSSARQGCAQFWLSVPNKGFCSLLIEHLLITSSLGPDFPIVVCPVDCPLTLLCLYSKQSCDPIALDLITPWSNYLES